MKMSVRPELTTAPPARVRDMRHTDGAVDNSALLPNHPGSTYKSGNAVQTAGATSQSFVQDVPHDPNACVIARAIIALGQSLGLAVIAEGVETEEQRAFLESNGCRQYQGYLYSRPLPLKEFGAYVTHMQGKGVEVVDVKSPP